MGLLWSDEIVKKGEHMGIYQPIQTERLILREFEEYDWRKIHNFLSDIEVQNYMIQNVASTDETKSYVQMFLEHKYEEPRRYVRFAVLLKADEQLIGECGINMPNFNHYEGEIVYRFAKIHWGKGYASEVVSRMLNFGFEELKLHRVEALCDVRNAASIRVLEKSGMTREGCMREHRFVKGNWRNSVIYSILEQEFNMRSSRGL